MFFSTRAKLIASFLSVAVLVGAVSVLIGGRLLYHSVLHEARNRVRLDLNAAREIYLTRINFVQVSLNITTLGSGFRSALKRSDINDLRDQLARMTQHAELDFTGVVGPEGRTICRVGAHPLPAETHPPENPVAELAIATRAPVSGTVILTREFLMAENPELARRARLRLIPTPKAVPRADEEETSGMALAAGIPVFEDGRLLAVLYGGILLNQSRKIVDTVRDTVFQNEEYKGRSVGTATVFFNDIRISTNVPSETEKRAVGTRVSREVKEHVLDRGEQWTERAFVVNDWYITAYDSIEDIFGKRVGMLYVGILEAKYIDIVRKVLYVFTINTLLGMVLAVGLAYALGRKIMSPVRRLIQASREVSEGSLTPDIGPISKDEIGVLQNTFKEMVAAMGRRRAQSQNMVLQSEKHASIGRLAAGVAHEINNPLTGVLTYTHMLLRRKDLAKDVREDLQTIAEATDRVRKIVKGLLDFSRQTKLDKETTDVNKLVQVTIQTMENHALVKGVGIRFNPGKELPMLTLDRSQFQSVLINIIINALDATEPGGEIDVTTGISLSTGDGDQRGVEIVITDTGCGIPPEHLAKLFDPFFTTKEVGKGTGLGLSVSLGIIQRHGGTIRVRSDGGKGSTFTIWVPIETK
ncbi:MAG: cache domain-containing protein [Deltaproteobacteria bacterium]|nr:cache domain-containing protein [Deltaproteobacteria bacterium]